MVAIPNRGSGSTTGWVHPSAVQTGQWIADRASGNPLIELGACNGTAGGYQATDPFPQVNDSGFLSMIQTLNGTYIASHLEWGNLEPYRPLGGDQTASPPTSGSRNFNGPLWLAVESLLTWADANGVLVTLNQTGAKNNTNANLRYADWCFDDSLWATASGATVAAAPPTQTAPTYAPGTVGPAWTLTTSAVTILAAGAASNGTSYPRKGTALIGGQSVCYSNWTGTTMTVDAGFYPSGAVFAAGTSITVGTDITTHRAPFPHDRSGYGNVSYSLTDDTDQRAAQYANGSTLVVSGTPHKTWHGDFDAYLPYFKGVDLQLVTVGGRHASCIGYKFFNEPNIGSLNQSYQVGNAGGPWSTATAVITKVVLPNFATLFDYIRSVEPERFIMYSGQGGINCQISPDFSILWTPGHAGGAGTCPDAFPFVQEAHVYCGGQGLPPTPMDNITGTDNDLSTVAGTVYSPDRDSNGNPTSLLAIFQALADSAAKRNVPLVIGEWGCPDGAVLPDLVTKAAPTMLADYAQCMSGIHAHQSYFNMGTSVIRGLVTGVSQPGGGSAPPYTVNPNAGAAYQALMASPWGPLPAPIIPAPLPTPYDQSTLDYKNAAQMRVAYDTRWLIKKATLQTVPGQQEYLLGADVLSVMSIVDFSTDPVSGTLIPRLRTPEAMRLLSTSDKPSWEQPMHYIIGTTLGILPAPTTSTTYIVYYHARPAVLDETAQYELTGDALRLVDRLANSYSAIDDGQLEVSQAEFQIYEAEMRRVRRRIRHRAAARLYTATETGA